MCVGRKGTVSKGTVSRLSCSASCARASLFLRRCASSTITKAHRRTLKGCRGGGGGTGRGGEGGGRGGQRSKHHPPTHASQHQPRPRKEKISEALGSKAPSASTPTLFTLPHPPAQQALFAPWFPQHLLPAPVRPVKTKVKSKHSPSEELGASHHDFTTGDAQMSSPSLIPA